MNQPLHTTRFPGESATYRIARDHLLQAEIDLRRQIEATAALRRALPLGGEVPVDYVFEEADAALTGPDNAKPVRLSELFADGKDSLLVYSFMYDHAMQRPCPACTSILDGLNGTMPHISQRTNLVVVAKSPIPRIRAFARERGWGNLRMLSSTHNSYNTDYHGEAADGSQLPVLNVFVRRDGQIRHFYCTELLFAAADPGQHSRHVDSIWPLWNAFDLIPEGRGSDWSPKLAYDIALTH
jgi:predicted dithiol-disulfide oxidoreductase (DUF899 family)